jgi:LysR family cys regulon transcriptional activator
MNFQQIEAICGIASSGFNVSLAAEMLGRSQPGLSRQIKVLQRELGAQVFVRTRNKVLGLTLQGEKILRVGERMLHDLKTLQQICADDVKDGGGELRIATTHVHARYLLPGTIKAFAARFPGVSLTLQQCDPDHCRRLIASGEADVGVITMTQKPADPIVTVPAYRLPRCVIVPEGHPLLRKQPLSLRRLAEYPLVAYPATFSGRYMVEEAFANAGLKPRIVCSATDADVCKAYVGVGMGIAVLAAVAFDPAADRGLVAIDASHLFRPGVLNLVFRKHGYLTRALESFVALFAPHVGRDLVLKAMEGADIQRDRLSQRVPAAASRHA